ncbi:MAG: chloride channel protein [Deltaproteobacteria bacterium]|nr:chloride channel protein [Deltaproteobacteria bacterium]MBW2084073.1 chloride channel protein [Deltaproteobacteria bacterium]HDM09605.1 chloride channel protein [Desulfobacteraceae bacterium]
MKFTVHNLNERLQLVIIGAVVGVGGGLASVALNRSLEWGAEFLHPYRHQWYSLFLPACGAALSIIFLLYLAKDIGGHGVPEVIYSVVRRGGLIRFRSSYSRLVSCCLTIASGGSAGPEGPVVISGGSVASNITSFFRLRDRQRIVLVGGGAAAAIASIFNAPVAGIAFSLEAIMGEWTPTNLITVGVASAIGTEVSRILQGNQIPFEGPPFVISDIDVVACLGLAVFTSFASVFFIRLLRYVREISGKAIPILWVRAACGGLLVGLIGLLFPSILGEGYGAVRTVIGGNFTEGLAIAGLIALAKIAATTLSIGTGGIGGIFAPCLVIGSFVGLFYQRLLVYLIPGLHWAGEPYFALIGMAGVISSVLQAPMTGIFLITEITGGYEVLVSVLLVSVISVTMSRVFEPYSVYHQELVAHGELLRPRTDRKVLSELTIMELLDHNYKEVPPEMTLGEFVEIVKQTSYHFFPVIDSGTERYLGLIHSDDIRSYLFDSNLYNSLLVEELMDPTVPTISLDDELPEVLDIFEYGHDSTLPVVHDGRFLGLISKATILDHYRKELIVEEEI